MTLVVGVSANLIIILLNTKSRIILKICYKQLFNHANSSISNNLKDNLYHEKKERNNDMNKDKTWKQGTNRPRILLDMDDVITDFLGGLIKVYNDRNGTHLKVDDVRSWDLSEIDPAIVDIYKEAGFFTKLEPKQTAMSTLRKLIDSTRYDVYIITACNDPIEYAEKVAYMKQILPIFNVNRLISCKEKEIIRGDLIVDDCVGNLLRCEPYMQCILMDMPHNQSVDRFKRIKNLSELIPLIERTFYPKTN